MENIKLSPRLQAIASLVPKGSSVIDVGTDHGYIPVWLTQDGQYGAIAATDINEGPLQNARRSASAYGVASHISFIRCSGLSFPGSNKYQSVIIAGMGGELITTILNNAPWTKTDSTLILQPNSKTDILNAWLLEHNYRIKDAKLVKDNGKIYQILVASGGIGVSLSHPSQLLVHPLYIQCHDPLLQEYLDGLIYQHTAAIAGMRKSRREPEELQQEETLLSALTMMRKETETW